MSLRSLRLLFGLVLASTLRSLTACTINVLPELDEGTDGSTGVTSSAGTNDVLTTGDVPTTTAGTDTTAVTNATTASDPTADPTGASGECDFAGDVQPIFTLRCSGCHGGDNPAQGLSLMEGSAYAGLVGVDSMEVPGTLLVAPGEPASSFLIDKLGPNPAQGATMPLAGMTDAGEVALITAWVAAGASETGSFACGEQTGGDVGGVEISGPGTVQVQVGEIVALSALVTTPGGEPVPDASITWTSAAELTVYVDGAGALLGISPGTTTVYASAGGLDSAPVTVEVVAHDPPAATFTQVRGVTTPGCAISGCHVDGVEPGDLRFDREPEKLWEELLEDGSEEVESLMRVVPNAPAESYLVHKLVQRSPASGAQMPIGGAPMAAASVRVIVRWIVDGAPFN